MTGVQVKRKGEIATRAGTHALSLLSAPLNVAVLHELAEGPRSLTDLRRAAGSPPQTTMRGHLRTLTDLGVVVKRRQTDFPGSLNVDLAPPGRALLRVAETLRAWLDDAPEMPVPIGSPAAKNAVKALLDGWSTCIVRALAARPLSLTELDGVISSLNYPSLERRLAAMRLVGQVEPLPGRGRSTPYAVSEWLRRAVAPLGAAAHWERQYLEAGGSSSFSRLDAEAAFLLAVPLISLPPGLAGSCRLTVEIQNSHGPRLAGVVADVEDGRVVSCTTRLDGNVNARASGSTTAWLRAVVGNNTTSLENSGDGRLVALFLDGLHRVLFGVRQST